MTRSPRPSTTVFHTGGDQILVVGTNLNKSSMIEVCMSWGIHACIIIPIAPSLYIYMYLISTREI